MKFIRDMILEEMRPIDKRLNDKVAELFSISREWQANCTSSLNDLVKSEANGKSSVDQLKRIADLLEEFTKGKKNG